MRTFLCGVLTTFIGASLPAASIPVPNSSFEAPVTTLAGSELNAWQKAPQAVWYNDPMFPWDALMGQFLNTAAGSPDHIDNVDGHQAAYLFALPNVGIFQDDNTLYGTNTVPSRDFHAQYEAGKAYSLTVGVLGGGGGMSNGATFEIALYFREANGNRLAVGATTITNTSDLFPTNTHFTDFQVRIPTVKPTDAWAGKRIGIQLSSTVGFDLLGGYWDIDNVRLTDSVVSNPSFESPRIDFAGPAVDAWQKAPQPSWYSDPNFPWQALVGQFLNTSNGSPDHLDNMEGTQGAYVFALPGVAIFQDSTSLGSTGAPTPTPAHEFQATFTPGKAYSLTVGVLGGGGGMSNGATFQMSLYYRDAASNKVTVAAKTITNTPALFPTNTHFTDFSVPVAMVQGTEAWAGKAIGIELTSTVGFELLGGYWDIDNVRLTENIIPNASFEWPRLDFTSAEMDFWQKAPQPIWYQDPQFPWVQLMGQFLNTSHGSPNHIDNMDGEQAAYLFALPDVALSYEEASKKFEQGKSYSLTVGVLGGGGGMSNGATFELSLYYRDANSNQVTVAARSITNTLALFPTNTHLTDFSVQAPVVKGHEPWAGKPIGIRLASTVGFDLLGGYWDIDDVRLRAVEDPTVKSPGFTNGQFHFVLKSAPGRYEILAASDPLASLANWTSLATVTNLTGNTSIVDTNANANPGRFYFARPSP